MRDVRGSMWQHSMTKSGVAMPGWRPDREAAYSTDIGAGLVGSGSRLFKYPHLPQILYYNYLQSYKRTPRSGSNF